MKSSILLVLFVFLGGIFISCGKQASNTKPADTNNDSAFVNISDPIPSTPVILEDKLSRQKASDKTYDSFEDVLNGLSTHEGDELWPSIVYFYYDITLDGKQNYG